jgi:hypothetical protein
MSVSRRHDDSSQRWSRVEAIFHEALLADISRRESLIQCLANGDPVLISEVESLVLAADTCDQFLENREKSAHRQ